MKKIQVTFTEKQAQMILAACETRYSHMDNLFYAAVEKIYAAIKEAKQ